MDAMNMTPSRPYLLRAFYEWLMDNNLTPHLLVDATIASVQVPQQYVRDGQIVLNIAPQAVAALVMDNDAVSCNARFGGMPFQLYVPMAAVLGIHSRENGVGTFFPPESAYIDATLPTTSERKDSILDDNNEPKPPRPDGPPTLRIVK